MKKLLLGGIWVCAVTVAAVYLATISARGAPPAEPEAHLQGLDYVKTRQISVPKISEGKIQGYVVIRLVFTIDADAKRKLPVPPEVFIVDEAFRAIYRDESIDFSQLAKTDLNKFTQSISDRVNERLTPGLIRETLVEQFDYVPYDAIQYGEPTPAGLAREVATNSL